MIIIFAHTEGLRLDYIFSRVFRNILGSDFYFTTNKDEFIASPLPSINYSPENLHKGLWIVPINLLFERGLTEVCTDSISSWKDLPTLFSNNIGDIPFDLFAASFFLLTRHEEYTSQMFDIHGRYEYSQSVIHRMGCIEQPIVDQWAYALKQELLAHYPNCVFSPRTYRFIPTIDVDHPFLYRNKGFVLNIVCFLNDLLKGKFLTFKERLFTVFLLKDDCYFNFKFLLQVYSKHGVKGLFFVHRGPYGKFDRRYIYPSKRFNKMIKKLEEDHLICIHPSYAAAFNAKRFSREHKELENVIGKNIMCSRHHYLRIRIPETYRQLLNSGITDDYSLIYSSKVGFRAGTSIPFPFYDVENDQVTGLIIHPTAIMDVTLKRDYGLQPQEALQKICELAEIVKSVNGDFITLFHNSTLSDVKEWKGWKEMYSDMINKL